MTDDALKAAVIAAGQDEAGIALRRELCDSLALAFRESGKALWLCGSIIGSDRVNGKSPFDFGSDATVGLGTVVQISGELLAGAIALLDDGNRYAAAALLRQLVEVEYLAWAFAEDEEEAMRWLRSTREERLRFWQPGNIRKRADGRFRGVDYALHCETGGHPTPDANYLLPTNTERPDFFGWVDLIFHGLNIWDYTLAAESRLGYGEELLEQMESQDVEAAREQRLRDDPLVPLFAEALERMVPHADSAV